MAFWVILIYFAVPSLPGWATKNWLPTLFASNLNLPMSEAGPISTITIAASSLVGVLFGGMLSDRWVQRNLRGRVYTGAIGLGLTIPSLFLLGFGHSLLTVVGAGLLFGIGYGMFDANNMPILCQFVSARQRSHGLRCDEHGWRVCRRNHYQCTGLMERQRTAGAGICDVGRSGGACTGGPALFLRPTTDNMA